MSDFEKWWDAYVPTERNLRPNCKEAYLAGQSSAERPDHRAVMEQALEALKHAQAQTYPFGGLQLFADAIEQLRNALKGEV